MNINVRPSSVSVPDFFRSCAHDLYPIGALYRVAGDQFNRALNACERGRTADLYSALINVRANAMRLAELAKELERKIDGYRADNIDDCPTVYAP